MKASFSHSIDVLVKAYLNNTLEHVNCAACAVGNLVADGLKQTFVPDYSPFSSCKIQWKNHEIQPTRHYGWPKVFMTDEGQVINEKNYHETDAKLQIDSTGYKWQDLARIEFAFETADKGNSDDDWMFNGLMAVVDVLADIHGVDLETKEIAKSKFQTS